MLRFAKQQTSLYIQDQTKVYLMDEMDEIKRFELDRKQQIWKKDKENYVHDLFVKIKINKSHRSA